MTYPRFRPLLVLPLAVFVAIGALLYARLGSGEDPSLVPSAMIGRPVPTFELPAVGVVDASGAAVPGLKTDDLAKGVFLVNVFASWCAPCRAEMPVLKKIAEDGRFAVVGIDYKDTNDQARRFLGAFGNPYAAIGADTRGRVGIDWGVYGVPETYVVADGAIAFKLVGPLSEATYREKLLPVIEKALSAGKS